MCEFVTAWRRFGYACVALAVSGCVALPAHVAEELRAPEAARPDHYGGARVVPACTAKPYAAS